MSEKNQNIHIDEKNHVEEPFLNQLDKQDWKIIRLEQKQVPADSFRTSFSEVVMFQELEKSLLKINPWLETDQLEEVVRRITVFSQKSLIENNQKVLELMLQNTSVSINRKTGERSPLVKYIDFENIENNSFIAVSQFKIRIQGTDNNIIPDILLFVNGLPWVIVECKSPKETDAIGKAINQVMRYSEQRGENKEGNQSLFWYNQFIVATSRTQAKFGTISTHIEKHFYRWTDPYPYTLDELEHAGTSPNDQQRLVAGMLDRGNLLDIIKSFTIFSTNDKGETIKIVGRYQQFRAVKLTIKRLLEGQNKMQRSGIIWHTQGSGKSLTMMFMVREMYRLDQLKTWKVVFVTDRTQLEQQLHETSQKIGFTVNVASSGRQLKKLINSQASDLVMCLIHKFNERDLNEIYEELNPSPNILIMTDEAHRSQYSVLAANLNKAMPEASEIAFTGTPTDRTEKKYKDYIDKYTMRQSIEDGVTLKIVYEGRTHNAEIKDHAGMDKRFADVFSDYDITQKLEILGYGSRLAYLEAKEVIQEKANDMVEHYIQNVFPNKFKAQIVATSREAAARYDEAINIALKKQIADLEQNNPAKVNIELLNLLKTAVIISGSHNDKPHINQFTDETYHEKSITSFKLPFEKSKDGISGDIGIIIVNNMLLTGFDAPIEQVLYLDKVIKEHNLLQAIARVNRVGNEFKDAGFVVDYVGVGNHLKEAIDTYDEKEQNDILESVKNDQHEINELKETHAKMWALIKNLGIEDLNDLDAFFDLFYDEDLRFEFMIAYKMLTKCLNIVLPRREALDYLKDYQRFTEINVLAGQHLRDNRMSMIGIPDKLRIITDEYLKSKGITQKIEPISIIDENFQIHVEKRKRAKTKAAEVEHAIRHHIEIYINEDPELYASFVAAIEEILKEFKNNWEIIYKKLEELRQKIKNTEKEPTYGLHRKKQMPFFRIFKKELFENKALSEDEIAKLVYLTQDIYNLIENELKLTGFWNSIPARNKLKGELQQLLLSDNYKALPNIIQNRNHIISRLMEIAESNNDTILYSE